MASLYDWSLSAGANANSDFNMAEGMAPSELNDGIRQLMARVRAFAGDLGGETIVGGTANNITVTANCEFTGYRTGLIIAFRPTAANTLDAVNLTVNVIGSKAVRKFSKAGEVALTPGDLQPGSLHLAVYDETANDSAGAWVLINPTLGAVAYLATIGNANWSGAPLAIENGGTAATTKAAARTSLGLGAVAQDSIVPIARGGTGAITAEAARTALGLGDLATKNEADLVFTGSGGGATDFPVGHHVMFSSGDAINRNTVVSIRISSSNSYDYTVAGAGALLTGTWRTRGYAGGERYLGQRVA